MGQSYQEGLQFQSVRQSNTTFSTRMYGLGSIQRGKWDATYRFSHEQIFNSSRTQNRFVQLIFQGSWRQYYQLSDQWALAGLVETEQFWSNQNQRHSLYLGTRYRPTPEIELTPMIGYSWDYRNQQWDHGISPSLQLLARKELLDGSLVQLQTYTRVKWIDPRMQQNLHGVASYGKQFNERAAIQLELLAGRNEMDNYRLGSVERILSDSLGATFQLSYQLSKAIQWRSANQFQRTSRYFRYEQWTAEKPEFNDFGFGQTHIFSQQHLSLTKRNWEGYFQWEYEYLGRIYEIENDLLVNDIQFLQLIEREKRKDYFRKRQSIDWKIAWRFHPKHRWTVRGNSRYLQFDTPSETNLDDHDELDQTVSTTLHNQWSRTFSTTYQLLGTIRRYAFLLGDRSQDNYTQRTLRMGFETDWQMLDNLRIQGQQWVYVTYHVKDFGDLGLTDRSTRNLESRLDLTWRPKPRVTATASLFRRETHVSYLNWDEFTETPLDTTVTYLMQNKWLFSPKSPSNKWAWQPSVGYKHFTQVRKSNTTMTNLDEILVPINLNIRNDQTGPETGAQLRIRGKGSLSASIWWQIQRLGYRYQEIENLSSLSSSYREENLLKPTIHFRPFFRAEANIALGK
ncbi:hypothetical protein [Pontibacter sp. G13]|uniref:hypothetical protein n=1 Tax=Pontibacter sp. G13 TaxID=3074898 RepID=UPI00288BE6D5|nr:hypothetical protein [Pontibacter sp. G13]WNJ20132.1 hypothetical protein RJD25_06580 [Pontibacter sp. G13]